VIYIQKVVFSIPEPWLSWLLDKKLISLKYSETSLNQPALGPKNMAGSEGWQVL
jgi:hypothetical protein